MALLEQSANSQTIFFFIFFAVGFRDSAVQANCNTWTIVPFLYTKISVKNIYWNCFNKQIIEWQQSWIVELRLISKREGGVVFWNIVTYWKRSFVYWLTPTLCWRLATQEFHARIASFIRSGPTRMFIGHILFFITRGKAKLRNITASSKIGKGV
jgi:hypothetical protein